MTGCLRALGLLVLIGGIAVGLLSLRRLPDAVPADVPPQIAHITDVQEEKPRVTYLHLRGGHALPHAALAFSTGDADEPVFYLVPLVDEDHPLKLEMEERARRLVEGDTATETAWREYASGRLDYSEVRMLLLSTDIGRWTSEPSVVVPLEWVEGVVRPLSEALDGEVVIQLDEQFADVRIERLLVLTEGEAPPEEEALRLLLLLSALAALLGFATVMTTLVAGRAR